MSKRPHKSGYLPSLDGWRALAILGVLIAHDPAWMVFGARHAAWQGYGGHGVYLFFAISGFLICTRILEDESLIGSFHLKAFYIRRLFRIQPASFCYLAAITLLTLPGVIRERWKDIFSSLLMYQNFVFRLSDLSGRNGFTAHFWTLSVEEHFYILLSLLLYFFTRHRIRIFASLIAGTWILQVLAIRFGHGPVDGSNRRSYWMILYLLTPSFLALLLRVPRIKVLVGRYLSPWVAYSATLVLMLVFRLVASGTNRLFSVGSIADQGPELFFGFALWIVATTTHPRSLSTRFLELPVLRFIGRLSYSLYLWHILFFIPVHRNVGVTWRPLLWLSGEPQKYIASFLVALASYYLIEKPLIRYGHKVAPPATPGHRDLDVQQPASAVTSTA